jgi:signal transduction histidine kinase
MANNSEPTPAPPSGDAAADPASFESLQARIRSRFGVLPNFFRLAPESPEITASLWGFARFAYLDNPLPSLFKVRLFVYLSQFCETRYCIIRHTGFLTGRGRPAGDAEAPVQSIGETLRLLRWPLPWGEDMEPHIARSGEDAPLTEMPSAESPLELSIFACATHIFLQSGHARACHAALKTALGEPRFEYLLVFLAFVRTAHYWSRVHEHLVPEYDVEELLATQKELAEHLVNDPDARSDEVSQKLEGQLEQLHIDRQRHVQISQAYAAALEVEEQLKRNNAELSAHLTEAERARTSALRIMEEAIQARQELWTSQQKLREAHQRKDEFLATLAHELRNPLAPITSSVQIMRLPGVNGVVLEQARKTIERQVSHLARLVDDLMDIARISRDRLELRREQVALGVVLQTAVETCSPGLEAARQQLSLTLPQETVWLDADLTRLSQAVSNVLNNASKYSPAGARIELSAEIVDREAMIRIRDEGMGISQDMLPQIFEMFRQGDASSTQSRSGLGIGLTLVKRLVEMHDGTIEARSAGVGQGSEFVLRLPVAVQRLAQPAATVREQKNATARRVLVVDDNRDAAASLALLLSHSGHHTRIAHDGLEALKVADGFRPEAIMLDIGMPKLDGFEVAKRIRETDWGKDILLVALTGWGQEEDRHRSQDAGFDRHLVKPVEYGTIVELLGENS